MKFVIISFIFAFIIYFAKSDILRLSNERLVPNTLKLVHEFNFGEGTENQISINSIL